MSELKHDDLVESGRKWLNKKHSIIISEMASTGEEADCIGWNNYLTTLIECKASRQDFLSDKKKWFRHHPYMGMGDYRYYLAPKDLIKIDELPEKWGLLEINNNKIRCKLKAEIQEKSYKPEVNLLISAIRRIGQNCPQGVSVKCYTHETKNKASLGIEQL